LEAWLPLLLLPLALGVLRFSLCATTTPLLLLPLLLLMLLQRARRRRRGAS
jgi:hypothetical protein